VIEKKSQGLPEELPSAVTHIVECASRNKMTYEQIIAVVEKYMQKNPEVWHERMSILVFNAVDEACAPKPPPTITTPAKKKR
jgi:hypothetical protein